MKNSNINWIHLFSEGKYIYTITILIGISLHAMDAFIISTLMPTIILDLGNVEFYSWVLMLYMTSSIIGSACAGIVRNFFGARNGYIFAGLIFLIGTLISGLSFSMHSLLIGRLISGFGAGLIVAQNTSLIGEFFSEKLRIKMIALLSTVWATAALTGPLIGGIFAEINFWRGGFLFALPLIFIFMITAYKAIPINKNKNNNNKINFPFFRIMLLATGVFLIGCTSIFNNIIIQFILISIGIFFLYYSIKLDTRSSATGLFPKKPFSLKSASGTAYWYFLMISILPVAIGIYMPLAYQTLYGLKPIYAGYLSALLAVFWSISATTSSNFSIKYQKAALIGGPFISFLGVFFIALGVGSFPWYVIALYTAITGTGIGFCMGHLMNWTISLSKKGEESITASSIHTVRSLGISLGAAGSGLIANLAGLKESIEPIIVARSLFYVEFCAAFAPALAIVFGLILISHRNKIEKFYNH